MIRALVLCISLSYTLTYTAALELECVGCAAGHYLDAVNETHGTCRRCPADSTTPPGVTAFDRLHCVCDPGHTPVSNACTECEAGLYKPLLGNHTCTQCPAQAHTNGTGKTVLGDCLCNPGFTLGKHRVSPPFTDMYGSPISIARGGYTLVTSPPGHPFRVSTHASLSRDYDYDGMTVNGDIVTVYVPDDFEGELYYYCYSHEGMHGSLHLDPSLIQCTACGPGTFKDEIGDGACDVCPENHYCPGNTVVPEQCPADSVSVPVSNALTDCACVPGFFADRTVVGDFVEADSLQCVPCAPGSFNDDYNQSLCELCPVDTFQPNDGASDVSACAACDVNAAAPVGSTSVDACACNLGYAGEPGATCVACVPGTFRSNSSEYFCRPCAAGTYNELDASNNAQHCAACPGPHTDSAAGSGSVWDCVCVAGFFHEAVAADDTQYECTPCVAGSFQPLQNQSQCDLCAAGTASPTSGATSPDVCQLCVDGRYSLRPGASACLACPASTYQNTSVPGVTALACTACPTHSSHNLTTQTDVEACRCAAGFVARGQDTDAYRCEPCEPGHYCPGDGEQLLCAVNSFADAGAIVCTPCANTSVGGQIVSAAECACVPGAEGTFHDGCALCPVGKFQPNTTTHVSCQSCPVNTFAAVLGRFLCSQCPANAASPQGADAQTDCVCVPGFVGALGGPCEVCPAGDFCPGGTESTTCRLHATSLSGVSSEAGCDCEPGYYSHEEDSPCLKCPVGSYCPGDLARLPCSDGSNSVPGAARIEACVCDGGSWRGCILAPDGLAYNDGGRCDINYTVSCAQCGADRICLNNTLQHCPTNSTAPAGSDDPFDCECLPGLYRVLAV